MESNDNLKIGFISGVFDGPQGPHEGHRYILTEAKKHCDYLFVSINSDDYIRRNKGREPCMFANERRQLLIDLNDENGIPLVDFVEIRYEDSPLNTILKLKPNFLIVGSDYSIDKVVGYPECKIWGGQVIIIDRIKGISTSNLLKSLK